MSQSRLRHFARATNLLVPSRSFLCDDPALAGLLRGFGAHPYAGALRPGTTAAFADAPLPGVLTCLPDGAVLDGSGAVVEGPGSADRIDWAREHMPVTRAAVAALADVLDGTRVGLSLVLEPKTAVLALELAAAGADVAVFGHADEVRPEVADALRAAGLDVYASTDPADEPGNVEAFLRSGIEWLLDDGAHLILAAADRGIDLRGAAEETTSGIRRLQATLPRIPVIASNDARSKTLFDNAYGTGQSCLLTICDLLDPEHRGITLGRVVVAGYGDVGWGFARLARALGGEVVVAELDPVRELRARMDGFATGPLVELAREADLLVSCTGYRHTVDLDVLRALPAGAAVAVAGGVDQEVALDDALADGATLVPVGHAVDELHLPGGTHVTLLDRGGCINCTAGEGNPIEIMDLSFGVQASALGHLLRADLAPGLHPLPAELDDAVARAWLEAS